MTWRLARRAWSPNAGLDMEAFSLNPGPPYIGYTPEAWSPGSTGGVVGFMSTYSNNQPAPWDGNACWTLVGCYGEPNPVVARWTANSAALPMLMEPGSHDLRASLRILTLTLVASGHRLILYVNSTAAGVSPEICTGISNAYGYSARLTNSWQLLTVDSALWSGGANIQLVVTYGGSEKVHQLAFDDLRLFMDEIEISEHWRQEEGLTGQERSVRTQRGDLHRHFLDSKRKWRIPVEYLPESAWTRIDNWYRAGAPLWLTDSAGTSWPVAFVSRQSPTARLHEGLYTERGGVLELESDYRQPLRGPVHAEDLP